MAKVEVVKKIANYYPIRLTLETVEEFSVVWCLLGMSDADIRTGVKTDYKGNADKLLGAAEEIWNKMEYIARKEKFGPRGEEGERK